ncbi:MAG: ABC-F family ATP-binding cassette domain-containing protein [Chloroflexi bacterium]|nr:ABC-F family ATP-binding cassette domain-containing protein [Chloroflexota bacterium]
MALAAGRRLPRVSTMLFAENLSKSFGPNDVLENVTFSIGDGDRVGLVGPNGGGKSTILRLLAGDQKADEGACGHRGGALGYLRQEAGLVDALTLADELWLAFPEAHAIERRLADVASHIERGEGDLDALIEEQAGLFEQFDHMDGYRIEARIGRVLDGLGFDLPNDTHKRCGDFSGGWQMRIALAKVLVRRPENVLLDEPTNHLDRKTRDWLADELQTYEGTVLIVTHDGEFLDKVANRILDLRDKRVDVYFGNYSEYQRQKAERLQAQDRAASRQERELARQERFIERFGAKATKASVVHSREKQLAKVERVQRTRKDAEVHFQLNTAGRTERDVLMIKHVGHAFGDHLVLLDVSMHIERGQKVALIGPNGSGKSTLLRIAAGHFPPTEGALEWAERARPGYYDQHQDEALDPERTVLDEVRSVAGNQVDEKLRTVLGQFLFRGDDVFKPIRVLSGGERSRVALAKFLIQPANVLLLDEPTNHLDKTTRRKLIEALQGYEGTILCASHDPGIVEGVATHVYEVKDTGVRELMDLQRS